MIAYLDLETTGLQPKKGSILEIAIVLVDDDLNELSRFHSLVKPMPAKGIEVMDDFVINMHQQSGLLAELYVDHQGPPGGPVLREGLLRCGEVEAAVIDWLQNSPIPSVAEQYKKVLKTIPFGGNSVHFDRAWLAEHMDDLDNLFSHRNIDSSTVNEMCKRWGPDARHKTHGEPKHRAMDDALASLETMRHYKKTFFTPVFFLDKTEASAR